MGYGYAIKNVDTEEYYAYTSKNDVPMFNVWILAKVYASKDTATKRIAKIQESRPGNYMVVDY